MPVSRKLWFRSGRELPRCRQANVSVRKLWCMPRAEDEAVHVRSLGLGYEPHGWAELATETKAHLPNPLIVSNPAPDSDK